MVCSAHGAPLGLEDVKQLRRKLKILDDPTLEDDDHFDLFRLDEDVLKHYRECGEKGDKEEKRWRDEIWNSYKIKYPKEAEELERRFSRRLPEVRLVVG